MEERRTPDRERAALDLIRDIRQSSDDPAIVSKLDALARSLTPPSVERDASSRPRRQFGAFAGCFKVGDEFFEPLSEEERQAWGAD